MHTVTEAIFIHPAGVKVHNRAVKDVGDLLMWGRLYCSVRVIKRRGLHPLICNEDADKNLIKPLLQILHFASLLDFNVVFLGS